MDGRLGKPSEIVVLVEDQRQQRFVRNYIARLGFEKRAVRTVALPAGKQSGEQYVREKYAEEVRSVRWRNSRTRTWLVVTIDADANDVTTRAQQLEQELKINNLYPRRNNEAIAHLIPKRNIETWILCLTGKVVDEVEDYKRRPGIEARISDAATTLFDWSRQNGTPGENCVPSLHAAIPEVRRLE